MEEFHPHKTSFVLGATRHGPMIFNRHDYRLLPDGGGYGVGLQLMEHGAYDPGQCEASLEILWSRRQHFGDGVVAIDCGANIGAFALTWARAMRAWGSVLAIEPQEPLFYALCGNIVLNNLQRNLQARWAAVGSDCGTIEVPELDYDQPASFGSLELRDGPTVEVIGQPIDYAHTYKVEMLTLDSLRLPRLDLLKIDVERMELEVLAGAMETLIGRKPVVIAEQIKVDAVELGNRLAGLDYVVFDVGLDLLAVHKDDPTLQAVRAGNGQA